MMARASPLSRVYEGSDPRNFEVSPAWGTDAGRKLASVHVAPTTWAAVLRQGYRVGSGKRTDSVARPAMDEIEDLESLPLESSECFAPAGALMR